MNSERINREKIMVQSENERKLFCGRGGGTVNFEGHIPSGISSVNQYCARGRARVIRMWYASEVTASGSSHLGGEQIPLALYKWM